MKCPECNGDFDLTWGRYLKAPLGRLPYPLCHAPLIVKSRWFCLSLLIVGMLILGIPLGYLGGIHYGLIGCNAGSIIGALLIGIPLDRYLRNKFAILEVQGRHPSKKPIESIALSLRALVWILIVPSVGITALSILLAYAGVTSWIERREPKEIWAAAASQDLPAGTVMTTNTIGRTGSGWMIARERASYMDVCCG